MSITVKAVKTPLTDQKRRSCEPGEEREKRNELIVRVAGDLFLARGFGAVSLEMIVEKTGGSFRDLYREFGSKEALFLRVLS